MSTPESNDFNLVACRSCGGVPRPFLDLGKSPVANRLIVKPDDVVREYALGLARCPDCDLVQNMTCLPSEKLFDQGYAYLSSVSAAVRNNADDLAGRVSKHLAPNSLVLDVGSNDGTLQRSFRNLGVTCLGVDPSVLPVRHARADGLTSYCRTFDAATSDWLLAKHDRFSAITMSNVLAHVANPLAMIKAAHSLLIETQGILVIEVQSWRKLVTLGAFDMVYHEHHSHFSLGSLCRLLKLGSFSVVNVEETDAQGGSLRLWCRPGIGTTSAVNAMIEREAKALGNDEAMLNAAIDRCRNSAQGFLAQTQNRTVGGYGAAAKTVTLLSALGSDLGIWCVADNALTKIGKYLPSHAIPIVRPSEMLAVDTQVIVLFAWNLVEEILPQLPGKEVWVPFPEFRRVQ